MLRNTKYAEERSRTVLPFSSDGEARLERLLIKSRGDEEIRLSWWKGRNMANRPLDLSEGALLKLLAKGIREGTLSPDFDRQLVKLALK